MVAVTLNKDLTDYTDSLIDHSVILNRSDAIRQIIIEHRDKIGKVNK